MKHLILLVFCLGCYRVEYTPLPLEIVDTDGMVTTWGIPSQFLPEEMGEVLEDYALSTGEISQEDYDACMRYVDIVVVPSSEIPFWCNLDIAGEHLTGCMYPQTTHTGYSGSHPNAWVLFLREDHANWAEGMRYVLQHEAVHMLLWCNTGSADSHHRSPLYP